MTLTKHLSKTYNREYWYNSVTKESTWIKPSDMEKDEEEVNEDTEGTKEIINKEKVKVEDSSRLPHKETATSTNSRSSRGDYSMQIANSNGLSWSIEGASHWTKEDYREKLQDLNQAMRDF